MEINLKNLNPEQKKAVVHTDGPLLIVAGAGTGKTTVITQRIGWIIEQKKAQPHEILALTFTDKAAGEVEERVDRVVPYGYVDFWISTFHAFAEKILKLHAIDIGLPNDFKLLNQTEQWMLVRQNLDKFDLDYYRPVGNPTKFIHALIKLFSRAKDEAITPQQYLDYVQDLKLNADNPDFVKTLVEPALIKDLSKKEKKELIFQEIKKVEEAANAYHTYQQLLLEHNSLDFGDLINYCLQLFKTRPLILAKYRNQFKYILVDEFQDTNHAQYDLVRLLAASKNNITVVGDDDQSIYKFRGASVSNILEFKKDYKDAEEIFLTKNYRSTQDILDLSYKFIQQNNPDRLEVKLAKGKSKKLSKRLVSSTKQSGEIKHLHLQTGDDEIKSVLEKIAELKEKDHDCSWADFAILARTNDAANNFSAALSQTQIPHRFVASRGLYSKPIILDVLAYLRLLDNYHESDAVYRILNSPIVGLRHQELVNFNYWARRKGYSLYKTIQLPEVINHTSQEIKEKIQKLIAWVDKHSQLAKEKSVGEVLVNFLEDTGYSQLIAESQNPELSENADFLNQFYRKIIEFERSTNEPTVKNFLQLIDLELEAGEAGSLVQNLEEGPDTVKVMTVHAAKGLEFKYVFLVNLVDRRFPTDDRSDPITLPEKLIKEILPEGDAHIQEERRLFYVAMTRAKQGLYLTSAVDYGGARKKKLSQFLVELGNFGLKLADEASQAEKQMGSYGLGQNQIVVDDDWQRMLPTKFSFTQIKLFERDPYQYWLDYILKIPQKGKNIFSFGSTLHLTLQQFFLMVRQRSSAQQQDLFGNTLSKSEKQTEVKVSLDELLNLYQKNWIDDWYQSRSEHDDFFERGKKALKDFYKDYQKTLPIPKFLEQPFSLRIPDEESGEIYTLIGKIDRVDQMNSGIEIIDYKTGQGKTEATLSADDKQQLLIYQLAAQQTLNERVEKLTFYYLETGNKVSFLGSQKELDNLQKKIVKIIREIRSAKWPPETPPRNT
ncbi:MAG: UvrD-helicase domain-containing protein [Candidatus Buchananbacteria bacterium]|nr:UvrD-helicase domain-containing protein [Candidatus Buchananbacteria bacterium]